MTTMTVNGRIGRDAEIRYTANNTAVCNIAVAYNYGRKDEQGNRPSQWVEAALWGAQAESLTQYLVKGACISVVLRDVHIEEYEGKNGTGTKLVGTVVDFEFLPQSKNESQPAPAATKPTHQQPPASRPKPVPMDDLDNDIPF